MRTFSERLPGFASRYAQRTQRVPRLLQSPILVASSNVGVLLAQQIGIHTSSVSGYWSSKARIEVPGYLMNSSLGKICKELGKRRRHGSLGFMDPEAFN